MKVVSRTMMSTESLVSTVFLYYLGETSDRINQFKKWFWSVLEKFNAVERQDLVRMTSDICLKCLFSFAGLLLDR